MSKNFVLDKRVILAAQLQDDSGDRTTGRESFSPQVASGISEAGRIAFSGTVAVNSGQPFRNT